MITVADAELLEREEELDALRALLADARDGCGGVAVVEAPAGPGQDVAAARACKAEADGHARAVGRRRRARARLRLRHRPPALRARAARRRPRAPRAPAGRLGAVRADRDRRRRTSRRSATTPATPACTALVWLAANLADEQPLAIVVDDAHWADAGSLRALGMLARRIEELPIALIVGHAPGRAAAARRARAPSATVLYPQPLSADAVGQRARRRCGELDAPFVAAAAETTGGNPLLVRELRRTLAADGFTGRAAEAEAVRRDRPGHDHPDGPDAAARALPPTRARWPAPLAVLGERRARARPRWPGSTTAAAGARARRARRRRTCSSADALRFTHPMMREAALAGVVAGERSALHRRAAALLAEAGASEDEIAAQLLAAEPGQRPARRARADLGGRARAGHGRHRRRAAPTCAARSRSRGARRRPELLLALGARRGAARRAARPTSTSRRAAAADDPRDRRPRRAGARPRARPRRPRAPRGAPSLEHARIERVRGVDAGSPPSSRTTCSTR